MKYGVNSISTTTLFWYLWYVYTYLWCSKKAFGYSWFSSNFPAVLMTNRRFLVLYQIYRVDTKFGIFIIHFHQGISNSSLRNNCRVVKWKALEYPKLFANIHISVRYFLVPILRLCTAFKEVGFTRICSFAYASCIDSVEFKENKQDYLSTYGMEVYYMFLNWKWLEDVRSSLGGSWRLDSGNRSVLNGDLCVPSGTLLFIPAKRGMFKKIKLV